MRSKFARNQAKSYIYSCYQVGQALSLRRPPRPPNLNIGAAHPHKTEAQVILEREVLQEIIRRFTAIDRREAIGPAFQIVLDIAVMERYGIRWILSFDVDFDRWPGLERIYRV
jgi:hypothetical protein